MNNDYGLNPQHYPDYCNSPKGYNKHFNCCNHNHNHECNYDCDYNSLCKTLNCICEILHEYKVHQPSYATFWQSDFVTVKLNENFPFNFTGAKTPDINLLTPTKISVCKPGVYQISYRVTVNVPVNDNPSDFVDQRISLYINGSSIPNSQVSFGILTADIQGCIPIHGETIIFIPPNSTLELKNDGPFSGSSEITTCDNGVNAITFNIVKID